MTQPRSLPLSSACLLVALWARAAAGATIAVPATADLQRALNTAAPGDVVELAAGAMFVGNFVLPAKPGARFITLRSALRPGLPAEGHRIEPRDAAALAKLRSPNGSPALQTAPGAHHWRIALIEFPANASGAGAIIALGDGSSAQHTLAAVPHDLVVDRCYVHGDPSRGQRRGIALNSAATTITDSYIADIATVGQDSQAIMAWNGPGPFLITNNYLEAAGENLLVGGADPAIPNLIPSDIRITGNTMTRPLSWRGQRWQIKNVLELKNARRVTISGNLLENNWLAAQAGFAVLFTVRNQDGGCPWCQVADVMFENNVVQHTAAGISILGVDDNAPSQRTRGITIRNNLFTDIDTGRWGGNGYFLMLTGAPQNIAVDHNTIIQDRAYGIVQVQGAPVTGFSFTNNLVRHLSSGIIGQDHAPGMDTLTHYFPQAVVLGNVIADGDSQRYPAGNTFPIFADFRRLFSNYERGDYRLAPDTPSPDAAVNGRAAGAALSAVPYFSPRP